MTGHDTDWFAARVAACAVGLAFAGRDDPDAIDELIDMADGRRHPLTVARARLEGLPTIGDPVRRHADRLVDAALYQLDLRRMLTTALVRDDATAEPVHADRLQASG